MDKVPAVVARYWKALAAMDGKAMARCYAKDAQFRDEVFDLQGADIGTMWTSLFDGTSDVRITTHPLVATRDGAVGTWEAEYDFSLTGRRVHNVIRSEFRVEAGKIVAQRDRFPFWKWSRMALGTPGLLLGWTPLLRKKVQAQAAKRIR